MSELPWILFKIEHEQQYLGEGNSCTHTTFHVVRLSLDLLLEMKKDCRDQDVLSIEWNSCVMHAAASLPDDQKGTTEEDNIGNSPKDLYTAMDELGIVGKRLGPRRWKFYRDPVESDLIPIAMCMADIPSWWRKA